MSEISVVIIAFNEANNIVRCIESVQPVADEILVIDSYSTDGTKAICESMGVRVIDHPFENHIDQKNFAVSQALYDRVLSLDADEYLSEELVTSILDIKKSWPREAYSMNRLSNYGGKWIRHGNWYPDKKIRLWNRRVGFWGGENPHDKVLLNPGVKTLHLDGDILHRAYNTSGEALAKVQSYSEIFAHVNETRKSSSVFKIILRSGFAFFKSYILKRGFLDGFEGLMVAMTVSNHVFYKYAKLFEANRRAMLGTHVAILRTDGLADVVLTLPLVGFLKKTIPNIKITLIAQGAHQPVAERCIYVDHFLPYEHVLSDADLLTNQKLDSILFVSSDTQLARMAKKSGVRNRVATAHRLSNWLYCNHLVDFSRFNSNQHESQLNFQLLRPFYINRDLATNELIPLFGLKPGSLAFDQLDGNRFNLVLNPLSSDSNRAWPLANYLKLADLLPAESFKIFITGTAEEGGRMKNELPELCAHPQVTDLTGRLTLTETISFISQADGIVSGHSEALHLGAVLGRLALGLYAYRRPQHPSRRRPIGSKASYMLVGQSCKNCENNQPCSCLASLQAETVRDRLLELVQSVRPWQQNNTAVAHPVKGASAALTQRPPRVTLIITTYNRKDALELVLKSALRQSVPPFEIIVADDGSREDTAELVQRYQKHALVPVLHCWQEDIGFRLAAVRNLAISQAAGDYVIMVDGDMILHQHFVKSHLRYAAPNRFLQGSRVLLQAELTKEALDKGLLDFGFFRDGIRSRFNALYLPVLSPLLSRKITDLSRTRGCNQSFWKKDLEEVNGFNEDFVGWGREDTEFMVRMLNSGKHCLKVKLEGFGYHLYHPESSKALLPANQKILDDAIANGTKRCVNGLDKHKHLVA
ncbi:MAG: glycosyltransferase [Cyclobacteriaceae bacterium]|nr:glycosyltransferase [Cyclobacteriaceae bacterium]